MCLVVVFAILVLQSTCRGKENGLLNFNCTCVGMWLSIFVFLPHSAMGWYVVSDCYISWSNSLILLDKDIILDAQ